MRFVLVVSLPPNSVQREFCRRLFRAGGASVAERQAFLDVLADAALKAVQDGRRVISTTGTGGVGTTFQLFAGFPPDALLSLIDAARAWADAADVTAALALVGYPVTSTHFENALER